MLRVIVNKSSDGAKRYFNDCLEKGDYYLNDQESPGQWKGKGAQFLGLNGQIDKDSFHALCDNKDPQSGRSLTLRTKEERRVGYDLNFHCPKGVSLVYELTKDAQIMTAFRASVQETMQELEGEMQTRVRKGGAQEDRQTGNLVYGEFVHRTSRPVEGIPDPHLHAHCFVFNATYDQKEESWKAGQFGEIKKNAPYFEAAFHARLALKLKELGYAIEKQGKSWDLAGISKETKDLFSRRTKQIEKAAKELGITNAQQKDKLGALTREKKKKNLSMDELTKIWEEKLPPQELDRIKNLKNNKELTKDFQENFTEVKAMHFAVAKVFERNSVIPEKLLKAEALRLGVGNVTVEGIKRQIYQKGLIRQPHEDGKIYVTHEKVLAEEKQMIEFAKEGAGKYPALKPLWNIKDEKIRSSPEQTSALLHVCRSKDRVIAVTGQAGTGKTTMMKETVQAIEAGGHSVFVFAPSSSAARGVLRGDGFHNAQTVEYLLSNPELQNQVKRQVLWIDEAGLLSSRSMSQIFRLAEKQECRVILSGDSGQHHSVERGDALRILEKHAEVKPAQITHIRRQRSEEYKKSVLQVRAGDLAGALNTLDGMKSIVQVDDSDHRTRSLTNEYLKLKAEKQSVLVVSPTHAESDTVTKHLRAALQANRVLHGVDRSFLTLKNQNWTNAEKKDLRNYEKGMAIKFHQNQPGIIRGQVWLVDEIDLNQNQVILQKDGKQTVLPLHDPRHFQVYRSHNIQLAVGDQVRITENSYSLEKRRLNNGDLRTITEIKDSGEIVLDQRYTLPKNFGQLAYGYCVTSHSSQGKTVDWVLIAESEDSLPAASREQFYVSLSRGRNGVKIFTDDKEKLFHAVKKMDQRLSAHDLHQTGVPQASKDPVKTVPTTRARKSQGIEIGR